MKTKEELNAERAANLAKARAAKAERLAAAATAPEEKPIIMPALPFDDDPMAIEEAEEVGEQTPFEVFLSALDDETKELVGEVELQAIFEAQQVKARAAKREKLKKAATERALHAANVHAGLLPQAAVAEAAWRRRMDQKVTFTPDLPELGDIGLRVDGVIYLHGRQVTVTMAQYLSFREMEWKNKQAELDFEGRSKMHHLRKGQIGANNYRLN